MLPACDQSLWRPDPSPEWSPEVILLANEMRTSQDSLPWYGIEMSDELEPKAHSERGPSTASRWRKCPGSVRLSRGLPDNAGIDAAHGTVFHEFAAICLELGLDPQGLVGDTLEVPGHGVLEFDQKMADHMLNGLDLLWSLADAPGAVMMVEQRVSLQEWVGPDEFGTTDCSIIDIHNWRLVTADWKYGAGVPVDPKDNDQAILYTLGTWSTFAAEMFYNAHLAGMGPDGPDADLLSMPEIEVVIIIEQPRAEGGGGVWRTTMSHILAEGEKIRRDAKRTEEPNAPVVPGTKQCQFCKAASFNRCLERPKFLLEQVGADFDDLESDFAVNAEPVLSEFSLITPEQRSQILLHRAMFEKLFEDLHAAAYQDAKMDRPVPGMKLVPGRAGARKWRDESKAELLLKKDFGEAAYKKTLLSPAAVEDEVGKRKFKDRFARMTVQSESKAILVPDTHKKEALKSAASDFDDLEDYNLV